MTAKKITFDDLLTRYDRKLKSKVFFLGELKEMYSPNSGYNPENAIECFIYEAPHGLISGGKWYCYNGDFYEFFNHFRDELSGPVQKKLRELYGRDAREVNKAIRAGNDREFQAEIATALFQILDKLCYTWAQTAANLTGAKIDNPHF